MAPQFSYISPGNWTEVLANTVRLGKVGLVTSAEAGNPAISTIVLDNPDGTLGHASDQIVAYKQFAVDDLTNPALDQRVYLGYIGRRTYRRGQGTDSSLRTTVANEVEVSLMDLNWLLTLHIADGTDANRTSSETVTERVAWLLGSTYLSGLVYDNGFVAASAVVMDPCDYTGQKVIDILGDCATQAFYNFFVYYDEAAGQASLWFDDSNTSTNYDSGCYISDDLADINQAAIVAGTATTFYGFSTDELNRDPERVYSKAYLPFAKGHVSISDATIESNFIGRDGSAPNANIKTLAVATTVATQFLADNDTEDDRITRTIWVSQSQSNAIKAGQVVRVKSTWMPGYSTYQQMRVLQRTLQQTEQANNFYTMALELSPMLQRFEGAAFAAILDSNSATKNGPHFRFTGDVTDPGWYLEPSVGPFTIMESGDPYLNIRADARMTIRIQISVDWSAVTSGDFTVSVYATQNGVTIGTVTYSSSGGLRFESQRMELNLNNVLVSDLDILSVATNQESLFWDGFGTNGTFLRVGRGHFSWDFGSVTWDGP